ncbi:MAG: hypothetical protein IJ282_05590 [Lachnospiraceae bacterium]|nr:hypothetical protein [Lachnospiraceae bacterium]
MKKAKHKKIKRPMSLTKKIALGILGVALVIGAIYLVYYLLRFTFYDKYEDYLTTYEYETGTEFKPVSEGKSDVEGMVLVSENEYLKLYTDTETAIVAVYDKRNGKTVYSNPLNADEDTVANKVNLNFLKSQFILYYYNKDVTSGTFNSYADSLYKKQVKAESIENGVRYIYQVGDIKGKTADGSDQIHFTIPLEYRLDGDGLKVSIPAKGIEEYGNGSVYRIQLLRYFGAAHDSENGYMVVPNGSGSLINFNNGKTGAANYSQYIYSLDPLAANYTTLENTNEITLPLFGICREDSSVLATVEEGKSIASITAGVSGAFNNYNYVYPSFTLRVADNLQMFGDSSGDVYVLEPELYDVNMTVRYTFLTEEYKGYSGLANYYRQRLIAEGNLADRTSAGDIPFYYDVIGGVKETSHFLGVQYLRTFAMTTFEEAQQMSEEFAQAGITNQVMNFQGWMNGGYYHDAADVIRVTGKLGGKGGLEDLNTTVAENGGRLYADVAFQNVTFADDGFNYNAESSRYYGAGYVASFGLVNPTTLRATSGLGYYENKYDLLSPKFLPRYVSKFSDKFEGFEVDGVSLRDLGNYLHSDKKRTNIIDREQALDVVIGQWETLAASNKNLMADKANEYAFGYVTDIINTPISHNTYDIVDESIPLYQMIIHGNVNYSTELLNFYDLEDTTELVLNMIEYGAAPHYVFTWEESSKMKNTGLNRYYATTYDVWKQEAMDIYGQVNEALKYVTDAQIIEHEIISEDVRKVTYDNGVIIYVNYGDEAQKADGETVPAGSYRLEGI